MNFLLKMRNTAAECSNVEYRSVLRNAADHLDRCIYQFCSYKDEDSMRALNGAWAYADSVLKNTPPEGNPAPVSGAPEPARLAA